ncbi:MAG: carbohydrate binding domain-containing protein [Phycisphaeraceae bacterium]
MTPTCHNHPPKPSDVRVRERRAGSTTSLRRRFRPPHRRGAVYLAVLGTSLIVTMIGVSALLTSRAIHRAGETTHRATEARYLAHAGVELALLQLADDTAWRTSHTHGQWSASRDLGPGQYRYRLLTAKGASLTSHDDAHAWLEVEGRAGDAVRIVRVGLQPQAQLPHLELIRNGDIADGTRHWQPTQPADRLEYTLADAHTGAGSLRVRNDSGSAPGIRQDITDHIEKDTTYRVQFAVRVIDDPRQVTAHLTTTNTDGAQQTFSHSLGSLGNTWQHFSFTLTPTWTGQLAEATFRVAAHNHTEFLLDSVTIVPDNAAHTMVPVPGTWQQVVR